MFVALYLSLNKIIEDKLEKKAKARGQTSQELIRNIVADWLEKNP